jgi:hypothetical protein
MNKINYNLIEGFKSFNTAKYEIIKSIIHYIDQKNWNKAKEMWILKIMEYKISSSITNISLFGSESLMFFNYIMRYQEYQLIQKCQQMCNNNNSIYRSNSSYIFFQMARFFYYQTIFSASHHLILN